MINKDMIELYEVIEKLINHPNMVKFKRIVTQEFLRVADINCEEQFRSLKDDWFCSVMDLQTVFKQIYYDYKVIIQDCLSEISYQYDIDDIQNEIFTTILFKITSSDSPELIHVYDCQRIRSRFFEFVKYLNCLRQRMPDKRNDIFNSPRLVHMLKINSSERYRPLRDDQFGGDYLINCVEEILDEIRFIDFVHEDFETLKQYELRNIIRDCWNEFAEITNIRFLASFQVQCFKTSLLSALDRSVECLPIVISADTGFGKTEAFLFPILLYAQISSLTRKHGRSNGCDAILLYPRIDLANNQLERVVYYIYILNKTLSNAMNSSFNSIEEHPLRIAIAHSKLEPPENNEEGKSNFKIHCPECTFIQRTDPNYEIGFIHIERSDDGSKHFVCSKNHDHREAERLIAFQIKPSVGYFDIAITTVDTLHRRLMDEKGSSSIWSQQILPRFFVFDEIHIYENQFGSHVACLIKRIQRFLKYLPSNKKLNPMPPIFIASSATLADPVKTASQFFNVLVDNLRERHFTPSVSEKEAFGRDYIVFVKIPPNRAIPVKPNFETDEEVPHRFVTEQATIIQSSFCLWHTMKKTPSKFRILTFIDSLDSVWRVGHNVSDAEKKGLFSLRLPVGRNEWSGDRQEKTFPNNDCPLKNCGNCIMPPNRYLTTCMAYEKGECWWTLLSDLDFNGGHWNRNMKVQVHSSGMRRDPTGVKLDSDDWDTLFTTSTLEVGFDHPELIATIQYQSPPSVASFFQRKGRAGRGQNDNPITVVILGNRQADQFYFHRHFRLSAEHIDAIRFDPTNPFIRRQHVLSCMMDYLSWKNLATDVYKNCNLAIGSKTLRDNYSEVVSWVSDILIEPENGVPGEHEVKRLVDESITRLESFSLPLIDINFEIEQIKTLPVEIFRENPKTLRDWSGRIAERIKFSSKKDVHKLRILRNTLQNAAVFREKNSKSPYKWIYPVELMNNTPIGDPAFNIPETFVSRPLGGYCEIINIDNGEQLSIEPKINSLNSFLPGGFKFRWFFKNWMAQWKPSLKGEPWVDISSNFGIDYQSYDELGTLDEIINIFEITSSFKEIGIEPQKAFCIEPNALNVKIGRELKKGHLYYNIRSRTFTHNREASDSWELQRDPISSVQFFDILKNPERKNELIEHPLLGNISFCRNAELFRIHYATIITAFQKNEQPNGLVVRFRDDSRDRECLPTIKFKTEAIICNLEIKTNILSALFEKCRSNETNALKEAYYRRVYNRLWDIYVSGDNNLLPIPHLFALESLWQSLMILESHSLIAAGKELLELEQSEIQDTIEKCRKFLEPLGYPGLKHNTIEEEIFCKNWDIFKNLVLKETPSEEEKGVVEILAHSLAACFKLLAADKVQTSPDLFLSYTQCYKKENVWNLIIAVYDNVHGGSGGANRFGLILEKMHSNDLLNHMRSLNICYQNCADQIVINELKSNNFKEIKDKYCGSSESLTDAETIAKKTLDLLTEGVDLNYFYHEVAMKYSDLQAIIKREPSPWELALFLNQFSSQSMDAKARKLLRRFIKKQGDIAEIIPRLQEIIPICSGSCPACLGLRQERRGRNLMQDYRILHKYLE